MNKLFAKCILYAYPNIDALCDQIDELVEKKALSSMIDTSPAIVQCEKILSLTEQKDLLRYLKSVVGSVLKKFSDSDLDLFDYKYFKRKPKSYYECKDVSSRAYFRRQVKIVGIFSEKIHKAGIDDAVFKKNFLNIEFFSELYKRVCEYEIVSYKNKKKPESQKVKKAMTNVGHGAGKITA